MSNNGRILIVDDNESNRRLLEQELQSEKFEVKTASSGDECLTLSRSYSPECIILDIRMPGMDGIETCRRLKEDPVAAAIPVLFLTGHMGNEETAVSALKAGGNDFLTKPYSLMELVARVSSQVTIHRTQARLKELVMTDELTGIYSRRFLFESLRKHVKQASRQPAPILSCLMIDIDHFKKVNDELGHLRGDEVLRWVAKTIRNAVRGSDVVARFGGEEFAVILPSTAMEGARIVAEKIRSRIEVDSAKDQTAVTVSVGVAAYMSPENRDVLRTMDVDDVMTALFRSSDQALYAAKRDGRNCVREAQVEIG